MQSYLIEYNLNEFDVLGLYHLAFVRIAGINNCHKALERDSIIRKRHEALLSTTTDWGPSTCEAGT